MDWLQANPAPALLIADAAMPVLSGPELLKRLRTDRRFAHLLVLICSGDPKDAVKAAALGGGHISKPFDLDALVALVKWICGVP